MVMTSLEPQKNEIRTLYDIGTIDKAKSCPKCHSVFVSQKECEACGYQLHIDLLGEPFGHKSFFGLRDEYYFVSPLTFQFMALGLRMNTKTLKKYRGALERRLKVLMEYFYFDDEKEQRRRLFLFEVKELIHEYWLAQGKLSRVWRALEVLEGKVLYQTLSQYLVVLEKEDHPKHRFKNLRIIKQWFNKASLGGLLPLSFLAKLILGSGAVIGASYLALRVLTAS